MPDSNVRVVNGRVAQSVVRRRGACLATAPGVGAPRWLALVCVLGPAAAGCVVANLQTARTLPAGTTRTTIGDTLVTSGLGNGRPTRFRDPSANPLSYVPPDLQVRHGLSERVDIGGRLLLGLGIVGDVKVNLLPPGSRAALALSAGVGFAFGLADAPVYVLHLPATLLASYDVAPWLTPYAAIGYRGYWVWGADDPELSDYNYTAPTGPGEGLVVVYLGVELRRASGRALLLEYGRLIPAVDDPGHPFTSISSHLFSIGFRTGDGSAFER